MNLFKTFIDLPILFVGTSGVNLSLKGTSPSPIIHHRLGQHLHVLVHVQHKVHERRYFEKCLRRLLCPETGTSKYLVLCSALKEVTLSEYSRHTTIIFFFINRHTEDREISRIW